MDELERLEERRKALFDEVESLGDFQRGSISVNYRKCGKRNCVCAEAEHPGHGPQYLWNATIEGKSRARNLKLGPELEKVQNEVSNYGTFLRLTHELIEVNEAICALRPVEPMEDAAALETLKKKLRKQFARMSSRKSPGSVRR